MEEGTKPMANTLITGPDMKKVDECRSSGHDWPLNIYGGVDDAARCLHCGMTFAYYVNAECL